MRILHIGTSDRRGGAAIASFRLFLALKKHYRNAEMLVRSKFSNEKEITGMNNSVLQRISIAVRFVIERIVCIIHFKSKELLFFFSPANTGYNIARLKKVREADILHLHWINQGFMSLKDLDKLFRRGKKIVWTMHDMWAFTGGCHYAGECENYIYECGKCPFLRTNNSRDLSYRILKKKEAMYKEAQIIFVSPSRWLAEKASRSHLLSRFDIRVIPNSLDCAVYKPGVKSDVRRSLLLPEDKFLILAGSANLREKRKGFSYLIEALKIMKQRNPEISRNFGLITFGKYSHVYNMPVSVYSQAYVKDDNTMAKIYQAADVFILPTLEDNFPNLVLESLACGTPVVAFKTGGITEMIDHKVTGYLAELKNIHDLVSGIKWMKSYPDIQELKQNCRKKVVENFSFEIIAEKYMKLYSDLLVN